MRPLPNPVSPGENASEIAPGSPHNHLLRKIPNPEALGGAPDPILLTRMRSAIAAERRAYLQEMIRDVEKLAELLRANRKPMDLWPLAHELRCMAGTYAYPFLTEVASVLCSLIGEHENLDHFPPEVTEVFAYAFLRARDHKGPCTEKEDAVIRGLRKIATQHLLG